MLLSLNIISEYNDEYNVILTDLNTYVTEKMTAFLTGEIDINDDAVWQEYLNNLDTIGIDRLIEIYAESYEASPLKWGA